MESRTNRLVLVAGLVLSSTLVGVAAAAEPDDLKGDFKQPLKEVLSGSSSKSVTVMTESNGKDTYKVTITDDEVSAEINGEKVPAERIRRKDGKIEILDANGGVVKTFRMMTGNDIAVQGFDLGNIGELRRKIDRDAAGLREGRVWIGERPGQGGGQDGDGPRREVRIRGDGKGGFRVENQDKVGKGWAPGQGDVAIANTTPPPVMIGITMSEPEDSVLEFLNIENAIRVDRVVEGLPGALAGLKSGDLIIEVKGEKGIGQERLREILRGAKPGDELAIKVARKGNQTQDVTLKLAAFDQSKLGMSVPGDGDDNQRQVTVVRPPQTRMWDEAQKKLDEAMKSLKDNPNLQPEALKKQLDEAMSKASDALKSAQEQMRGGLNQMRFRLNQNGDETVTIFPGQNGDELPRLLEIPAIPQTPRMDAGAERRIEALERKIDNLNKRMDEIRDLLKEKQGR
jgi:hypothetical protein